MIFRLCVSNTKSKFHSQEKLTDKQKAASLLSSFKLPAQNDDKLFYRDYVSSRVSHDIYFNLKHGGLCKPSGKVLFFHLDPWNYATHLQKMFEFT